MWLDDYGEEYKMMFPTNRAKKVLSRPQVDFYGFVKIDCKKTGTNSIIHFHKPSSSTDRFKVVAHMFTEEKTKPLYTVKGKWNGLLTVEKQDGDPMTFFSAREAEVEPKIMYPVSQQSFYESRRLWRDTVRALVEKNYELAERLNKEVGKEHEEMPLDTKYFKKVSGRRGILQYELQNQDKRFRQMPGVVGNMGGLKLRKK